MNHYGNIKKWNDERGFGFIQEEQTNTEYFAHISSFTPKTPRPQIGERVIFDTITSDKGRKEAKNIYYLERPKPQNRRVDSQKNHRETSNNRILPLLESLLSILVIAGIGYFIYNCLRIFRTPVCTKLPMRWQAILFTNAFLRRSKIFLEELPKYRNGWRS